MLAPEGLKECLGHNRGDAPEGRICLGKQNPFLDALPPSAREKARLVELGHERMKADASLRSAVEGFVADWEGDIVVPVEAGPLLIGGALAGLSIQQMAAKCGWRPALEDLADWIEAMGLATTETISEDGDFIVKIL